MECSQDSVLLISQYFYLDLQLHRIKAQQVYILLRIYFQKTCPEWAWKPLTLPTWSQEIHLLLCPYPSFQEYPLSSLLPVFIQKSTQHNSSSILSSVTDSCSIAFSCIEIWYFASSYVFFILWNSSVLILLPYPSSIYLHIQDPSRLSDPGIGSHSRIVKNQKVSSHIFSFKKFFINQSGKKRFLNLKIQSTQ